MSVLVGAIAVVVVAWFAAGTIWNVRKGSALMRWMQGGLAALGSRTTVRWLGSTAVEMGLRDVKDPFSAVTLVIFLAPRDLPWMRLLGRGRGDTLIVRGTLRRTPSVELEALDPASWSGREAFPRVPREWLVRQPAARGGAVVHYANANALARVDALLELAERKGLVVRRLSVRRTEPHFQVHVGLPDGVLPAREFFEAVRGLAELALG